MRLGASAYLAHGQLAGPNFEATAAAGAALAFTSLHISEDSPSGVRAAATAIVSDAASSGLSIVADVSPNTARLVGDSPWEFLWSIGVARVRIGFGFSVLQILSIDAGVYDVYVGDPVLIDHSWSLFGSFVRDDVVVLDDS